MQSVVDKWVIGLSVHIFVQLFGFWKRTLLRELNGFFHLRLDFLLRDLNLELLLLILELLILILELLLLIIDLLDLSLELLLLILEILLLLRDLVLPLRRLPRQRAQPRRPPEAG